MKFDFHFLFSFILHTLLCMFLYLNYVIFLNCLKWEEQALKVSIWNILLNLSLERCHSKLVFKSTKWDLLISNSCLDFSNSCEIYDDMQSEWSSYEEGSSMTCSADMVHLILRLQSQKVVSISWCLLLTFLPFLDSSMML